MISLIRIAPCESFGSGNPPALKMRSAMHTGVCILAAIQLIFSITLATPNIGIRADFLDATGKTTDRDIQSYSGIIKFDDGTIPLDKTKMTDAKLLHLCVLAYNEMVNIWRPRNLVSDALPGAMAAIAYEDKIYFASALRAPAAVVKLANVAKGSVREYMDDALSMGLGRFSPASTYSSERSQGFNDILRDSDLPRRVS